MTDGIKIKKFILPTVILLLLAATVYLFFFYKQECKTQDCFNNAFWFCKKATFTSKTDTATWQYIINGFSKANGNINCVVDVKAVDLQADAETIQALKGKSMSCSIPKELAASFMPETKIEYCHGMLKESIQDLMLKKMHLFIVQNIGQINQTAITPV